MSIVGDAPAYTLGLRAPGLGLNRCISGAQQPPAPEQVDGWPTGGQAGRVQGSGLTAEAPGLVSQACLRLSGAGDSWVVSMSCGCCWGQN